MTETDLDACRLSTMTELADMRRKRLCLVTRAERMQRQLQAALNMVGEALAIESGRQASGEDHPPDEKDWPTYTDLTALHKDMRGTCNRIGILNDRMRQWGVID